MLPKALPIASRSAPVGSPAGRRLQAAPVERVIPRLRRIVEDRRLVRLSRGRPDDRLERPTRKLGPGDELVQRLDVGLVVLSIVESDGSRRDHGRERILGVRQPRKALIGVRDLRVAPLLRVRGARG